MMTCTHRTRNARRRAVSLVEVAVSTLFTGLLLLAALQSVRNSAFTQYKASERATAEFLGDALLAEIIAQAYEEPSGAVSFGRESGESGGSRPNWDDVDDYTGWSESPPQRKDGTTLSDLTTWQRSVTVQWVTAANTTVVSGTETGLKRIVVSVSHNGKVIWNRAALRGKFP